MFSYTFLYRSRYIKIFIYRLRYIDIDMKLDIVILSILEKEDKTGYSLMKSMQESIGWKPSPGSIYPSLKNLLNKKYVSVIKKDNKKIYSLTKEGKSFLEEFKKHKEEQFNQAQKHVNFFGHLFGAKEIKVAMEMMHKVLKKGELFGDMTKDLMNFRVEFMKKVLHAKDRDKLKAFVKKWIKELKEIK